MTPVQTKILEMFRSLPNNEQQELVAHLAGVAAPETFYEQMTPEQRAKLECSIAEADRGEGLSATEVFAQLAKKYGFGRAA